MKIEEVQSTTKKQRVATHTHIKGLGLEVYLSASHSLYVCNYNAASGLFLLYAMFTLFPPNFRV